MRKIDGKKWATQSRNLSISAKELISLQYSHHFWSVPSITRKIRKVSVIVSCDLPSIFLSAPCLTRDQHTCRVRAAHDPCTAQSSPDRCCLAGRRWTCWTHRGSRCRGRRRRVYSGSWGAPGRRVATPGSGRLRPARRPGDTAPRLSSSGTGDGGGGLCQNVVNRCRSSAGQRETLCLSWSWRRWSGHGVFQRRRGKLCTALDDTLLESRDIFIGSILPQSVSLTAWKTAFRTMAESG